MKLGAMVGLGGVSLVALSLALSPVLAAASSREKAPKRAPLSISRNIVSSFTPSVADPRLAAEFARRGFSTGSFRFTPPSASPDKSKAVRVAVRTRGTPAEVKTSGASAAAVTAITPTAYNLGVAVGWKRFAVAGDFEKIENGVLPGARRGAELGLSYSGKKFGGGVKVAAERAEGAQRLVGADASYSLDVGGSYSIARNVDLTGGVRYKIQRERLEPLVDERRDSQAVYIGTAFRF
ncbi:MAG TPA: porin [Allosphingosinicella sp.]|uniref:porin n=1 Tax=Allosphingosinicella sp. TaxID=2823234 RepID=UPI002EDA65A5